MADLDQARRAKEELKAALAGRAGVSGIGIAPDDDGYGLLVRVRGDAVTARRLDVPTHVHGVAVHVRTTGPVSAQR
ncbi:MAG: hypothetical protein J7503_08685 [Cellulomonas iranensis]|uniref:hypothetical protein n=1 Tax=Cellulomonas iranensis TaxID=76862 RepID=UPI000B3CCC71|nr:hypothetical protein [Cellulomonas iranensis]MBO9568889.1 hypothetical protein [Cellulomonas iranensis]UCN14560.1 hypothetical protein LFM56_17140 [Cellulomonas iranensis]